MQGKMDVFIIHEKTAADGETGKSYKERRYASHIISNSLRNNKVHIQSLVPGALSTLLPRIFGPNLR